MESPRTLIDHTVTLVRGPLAGHPANLVVIAEQPYLQRPQPWVAHPATLYQLHWPDGATTWHDRHEFKVATDE